jgi:hypothetical protein
VQKYCRSGQSTVDNRTHAHCMLYTYGYKHTLTTYNTVLTAFPLQQWLHERASMFTLNVDCLSCHLAPTEIRSTDSPARSESVHQLSYPGRPFTPCRLENSCRRLGGTKYFTPISPCRMSKSVTSLQAVTPRRLESLSVFFFSWRDKPLVGLGLLIHEVYFSKSHTTTHHSR